MGLSGPVTSPGPIGWLGCLALALVTAIPGPARGADDPVARADHCLHAGELSCAIRGYRAALKANPASAGLQYKLGLAFALAGDLRAAVERWARAASMEPRDRHLERILVRAKLKLALERGRRRVGPGDPRGLLDQARYEEASRALEARGGGPGPMLVEALWGLGRVDEAREVLSAVRDAPGLEGLAR